MEADTTDSSNFLTSLFKKDKDKQDAGRVGVSNESDYDSDSSIGPVISVPTEDTHYKVDHIKIGIALIFNHTNIEGQSKRWGTDKDRKRIKRALRLLGFDVRTYDDLPYQEINEILEKTGKEDHSNHDCFVAVVMSHGLEGGKVFASDMPYPVDRLWNPFLGKNCKTLRNKPKLFFIQACRGEKLELPVQYEGSFQVMSRAAGTFGTPPTVQVTYTIPNTADLLVMYSTFEGSYSWRNPNNGSWFIQSLSHVIEQGAKTDEEIELMELLTAVNRKVAYEYQSNVPKNEKLDEMKEMPNFVSTLTKKFKFKPKT